MSSNWKWLEEKTKGGVKRTLGVILSMSLMATSIALPSNALASNKNSLSNSVVYTMPVDNQVKVKPNSVIEIKVDATTQLVNEINSNNDKVGILLTDDINNFLATQGNGNLTVNYDSQSNTVTFDVNAVSLNRYTNYKVYLLEGDALNKYNAYLKSNGHSQAFSQMIANDNDIHFMGYSFETGSAIGEARNWSFNVSSTGKVLTTDGVTITANATDDYNDMSTSGSVYFNGATDENGNTLSDVTAQPSQVQLNNGTAQIKVTANSTEQATLNFTTSGQYPEDTTSYKTNVYFVKPVESGSKITATATKNSDGTFTVTGNVTLNGSAEANVGVPLEIKNGTLSDNLPVTDSNGTFTITVTKDNNNAAILSLDTSKVSGVTMPVLGIDPTVYGNQAWTDTGINITSPNTLIQVQSTGSWAGNLYAKVGNGSPVLIGANGGYVTGVTGELYLGPNNTTYSDNVDSTITINDPKSIGIYPTLNLVANPTQITADGKSTSTISGQVLYGQYPLVDGTVNLSTTLGTLSTSTPTTNSTGDYSATLTAGTTTGTATITGTFENLTQTATVTLQNITNLANAVDLRHNPTSPYASYAIDSNGSLWGWVNTNYANNFYITKPVKLLDNIIQMSSYDTELPVFLKSDGTVWQANQNSELTQVGSSYYFDATKFSAYQITGLNNVSNIYNSYAKYDFAVCSDGSLWYWLYGDPKSLKQVQGINNVKSVAFISDIAAIILKNDGTVWEFDTSKTFPVQVSGLNNITKLINTGYDTYALRSDGTLWRVIIYSSYGTVTGIGSPVQIISNVSNVYSTPGYNVYVVKNDGTVWTWGNNYGGEFGNGTATYSYNVVYTPTQVKNVKNIISLGSLGFGGLVIAIDNSNKLWAWGSGYTTPVQINSITNAVLTKNNLVETNSGSIYVIDTKLGVHPVN